MAKRKMPNNELTLRKSTTQEKLIAILEELKSYYLEKLIDYESDLKESQKSYPDPEKQKKLEACRLYSDKMLWLLMKKRNYADDYTLRKFEKVEVRELMIAPLDVKITRYELKQIISGAIDVFNNPTISNWIGYLINHQYLLQNPDSYILKKTIYDFGGLVKKTTETIMPKNDTRYWIYLYRILQTLFPQYDTYTYTPQTQPQQPKQQTTLTLYESRSPNDQETIKDNSSVNPLKSP